MVLYPFLCLHSMCPTMKVTFPFVYQSTLLLAGFCFAMLTAVSPLSLHGQSSPPNILLIIADDLGADVFNGYHQGALMPSTPTLDSLRYSGITFENAWSAPSCTPTRATTMSGKYGIKTGVLTAPGNLDTVHTSLFRELSTQTNNSYADAVVGKWHISMPLNLDHPTEHGVDHYMGVMESSVNAYDNWERTEGGQTTTDTNYVTSAFTDEAIGWVNNQNQPWFLWLAHVAPHNPVHTPPAHMYTLNAVGTNFRKYIAMIESLDYEVNRLLNSIPDSVLANTVIFFIGDNGTPGNFLQDYPAGHGKGTLYQGGIRVPMFVSGSGVTRQGVRESALVHVNDLYATILELGGANLPGGMFNSLSFKHLLSNPVGVSRDYNYCEITSTTLEAWTIRNAQYKLIQFADNSQEFYDLVSDSLETTDLIPVGLTSAQGLVKTDLEEEAAQIRSSWSCQDHIQNGNETDIDCGGTFCQPCSGTVIPGSKQAIQFELFPNPSSQWLNLRRRTVDLQKAFEVIVRTQQGVRIGSKDWSSGLQQLELNLSGIAPQVLVIELRDKNSLEKPVFLKVSLLRN